MSAGRSNRWDAQRESFLSAARILASYYGDMYGALRAATGCSHGFQVFLWESGEKNPNTSIIGAMKTLAELCEAARERTGWSHEQVAVWAMRDQDATRRNPHSVLEAARRGLGRYRMRAPAGKEIPAVLDMMLPAPWGTSPAPAPSKGCPVPYAGEPRPAPPAPSREVKRTAAQQQRQNRFNALYADVEEFFPRFHQAAKFLRADPGLLLHSRLLGVVPTDRRVQQLAEASLLLLELRRRINGRVATSDFGDWMVTDNDLLIASGRRETSPWAVLSPPTHSGRLEQIPMPDPTALDLFVQAGVAELTGGDAAAAIAAFVDHTAPEQAGRTEANRRLAVR